MGEALFYLLIMRYSANIMEITCILKIIKLVKNLSLVPMR